ncbi:FUSC family protein [Photobacterium sp. SDRW27]|uniref:FUSC family protein n=1 Tax=Photobacterium obscurum TaxID=2829490 RepID=UPI002242DDF6|nr:FUSC family protein [Photobacterium obscurum]MCW8329851.1 FUSC family protein [Photobacterium obscurum]
MVSERCKLPLKVALALTLAIVSALWLGWDKPYWAGFAVIVMSVTETTGHSLRKGRHRLVGTLIGVISAFLFVDFFAQQQFLFLLSFTFFAAFCVYRQANSRTGYIWSMALMVCTLIVVMGKRSGELTFSMGVLRLQETILGVVCFTLVFSLFWPTSSRRVLHSTLLSFFADQQGNVEKTVAALAGKGERLQGLGFGDGLKFLTRLEDLLPAAKVDSYHIASEAEAWNCFMVQCREWALLCGHLSEASELLDPAVVKHSQQDVQALLARVKCRFVSAEAVLRGASHSDNPIPVMIALRDEAADDPQQHGAMLQLEQVLNDLDQLSFKILKTLCAALALDTLQVEVVQKVSSQGWSLERVCQAFKAWGMIWIFIGLWLFVPMTGGSMIVMLGVILASVVVSMPFCDVKTITYNMVGWSCVILLQYALVMPYFTEVWQLATFYFLNCFGIWYWFSQPQQVLSRMLGSQLLIIMTMGAVKLQPVYDIQGALLQLFLIGGAMLVIYFVNRGLFSSLPERVFLRHIKLLRYLFAWQLRRLSLSGKKGQRLSRYFGQLLLGQSPLRSVVLAEQAMARLDWPRYPELDREKVAGIISRLYALTLRLISLQDGYAEWLSKSPSPQMTTLLAEIAMALSGVLERTGDLEHLQPLENKLDQLQSHLHQCVQNINADSVLLVSLTAEQALHLYRVLAALKLIIADFKQLTSQASASNLGELKYNYFTL